MAFTWSGSIESSWSEDEEAEEPMAAMRTPLQTMAASGAEDAVLEDLQRRLNAAIADIEQGRAREAALLRRAQISAVAEAALASQMVELEAEAFTQANHLPPTVAASCSVEPFTSQLSMQVGELDSRLQVALEEVAAWAQRCQDLETQAEEGRVREAAFQRRAETAEAVEEVLASQMAELEAEAFAHITEKRSLKERCNEKTELITHNQVEELERQLAAAEEELNTVHAKLHQAEETTRWLEMCVAQLALEEKEVTRKSGDTLLSASLEDLAGVKLKLWNPSCLALTSH